MSSEPESWDLEVGDHVEERFGPFLSSWEVQEIIEAGARLRYRGVRFVGFEHPLRSPGGDVLTEDTQTGFLGRAHWPGVKHIDTKG